MKPEIFFYLVVLRGSPVPHHLITNRDEAIKFADSHVESEFWCVRKGAFRVYLDLYKKSPGVFEFHDESAKNLFEA